MPLSLIDATIINRQSTWHFCFLSDSTNYLILAIMILWLKFITNCYKCAIINTCWGHSNVYGGEQKTGVNIFFVLWKCLMVIGNNMNVNWKCHLHSWLEREWEREREKKKREREEEWVRGISSHTCIYSLVLRNHSHPNGHSIDLCIYFI